MTSGEKSLSEHGTALKFARQFFVRWDFRVVMWTICIGLLQTKPAYRHYIEIPGEGDRLVILD